MSYTLNLGENAPDFSLPATDGKSYRLSDFSDKKLLVVWFTCNHCPYVIGSDEITRQTVEHFNNESIAWVAINANSPETYKEDDFESMIKRMSEHKFPWTYLFDETQQSATDYGALKTPHFFLFDSERKLIYTGRGNNSPRDATKVTQNDLQQAIEEHLNGEAISVPVTNPIGCNIKWKGKDRHWMPGEACDLV